MRTRPWTHARRHPWPPTEYEWADAVKLAARERARVADGKLTQAEWELLSPARRRATRSPELHYWASWLNNQSRRGARRAAKQHRRALTTGKECRDAEAFYREVRAQAWIECFYCGAEVAGGRAEIDHMMPLSRGGEHRRENLAAACARCNRSKGRKTAEEFRAVLGRRESPSGVPKTCPFTKTSLSSGNADSGNTIYARS